MIYHKTEYRERRDHYAFYSVSEKLAGFDTDRDTFLGAYNGVREPDVVLEGQSGNSMASGWYPIASHCLELELQPGESKELVFILGYIENEEDKKWAAKGVINKEKAYAMIEKYGTADKADAALSELKTYWTKLLSVYSVKSNDEKMDRMVNIWNQYQCMVTFNMSRSASYFETGIGRGMGFRDSNQDLMGFVHLVPDRARERIIDIASTQFKDGGCYHQYQPLTKKGNNDIGGGFNDDPLWLICGTAAYIKETGDYDILNEQVPFDCNPEDTDTLLKHLEVSFMHVINNLGPHGLPLIGRADWNDCLNLNCFSDKPDESYQTFGNLDGRVAESVFIAGLFVYAGKDYVEILKRMGQEDKAKEAEQYFAEMARIGVENGLVQKALDNVREKLDTKYGIVLQQPAYTKYYINLGEISSYPEGYKENAGIFCHNNPWIMITETELGNGEICSLKCMGIY